MLTAVEKCEKKVHHEMNIIRSVFLNIRIYYVPGTYKCTSKKKKKKKSNPLHILSLKMSQCIIFEINWQGN